MRQAVVEWSERHPEAEHLLIGETPFVGRRFVELAHRLDDRAENLLTDQACRFVITVPSAEVRRFLEGERERRAASPLHPREREDAPPSVLRDLWRDLSEVARLLGITTPAPADRGGAVPYAPAVYQKVYERYGEQWIFTLDRATGEATLRGGDLGWGRAHAVHDGRVDGLILLALEEAAWRQACWSAARA